ncbi:phenol hydroxylase subunit [Noviherbaspirillum denitrificans]|uniref:Phenol hydroxylase n=1 Tax=Noviherbaspirillum denitrificans TaxID=1968433 RepID=A0A254TCH2_9BURK|nr:phenol hydroxylase subunit [Noviherbaspirillum denitrificans]OWW20255.1 phenol hydroxylase [Noviherbaspirillum denitrificans]
MSSNTFDTARKFVRVIEKRDNGMVEFEFAIGEPELFVELLLPGHAFAEFCSANAVTVLDGASPPNGAEASEWDWNLRQATHQRFK